ALLGERVRPPSRFLPALAVIRAWPLPAQAPHGDNLLGLLSAALSGRHGFWLLGDAADDAQLPAYNHADEHVRADAHYGRLARYDPGDLTRFVPRVSVTDLDFLPLAVRPCSAPVYVIPLL